ALALPNPALYLSRGHEAWLSATSALVALGVLSSSPWPGGELALGVGVVTTALAVLGLWRGRRRPFVRVLALTALTLFVLVNVWWFPPAPGRPGPTLCGIVYL